MSASVEELPSELRTEEAEEAHRQAAEADNALDEQQLATQLSLLP